MNKKIASLFFVAIGLCIGCAAKASEGQEEPIIPPKTTIIFQDKDTLTRLWDDFQKIENQKKEIKALLKNYQTGKNLKTVGTAFAAGGFTFADGLSFKKKLLAIGVTLGGSSLLGVGMEWLKNRENLRKRDEKILPICNNMSDLLKNVNEYISIVDRDAENAKTEIKIIHSIEKGLAGKYSHTKTVRKTMKNLRYKAISNYCQNTNLPDLFAEDN